jgi:hypothetical protein
MSSRLFKPFLEVLLERKSEEKRVDLARDVAFEAADDVGL